MNRNKRAMLIIMDGWGKGLGDYSDAIAAAQTPFIDNLYREYPHSELVTYGESVGLPNEQMGNSEVGHLNIGAGRVVYQDLLKIDLAMRNDDLKNNTVLLEFIRNAKASGHTLHLMGLLSDGGVHSSIEHLKGLIDIIEFEDVMNCKLHAFTDGRDTDPKSGIAFIKDINLFLSSRRTKLVSAIGRYYAMDRDKRWERIKLAYDLLTLGKGNQANSIELAIQESYSQNVTDEFLQPVLLEKEFAPIKEGDYVLCFNFRTDRCRQITRALTQEDLPEAGMHKLQLNYCTMTNYDDTFKNIKVLFQNDTLQNTLGEVLSKHGLHQIRAAETEKYPHVTFFFNGGQETPYEGEIRILVPSPKVATYDLQPEMSAYPLKDEVIKAMNASLPEFICVNFANTDMVGHTGVFDAVVKAAETVNKCVEDLVNNALKLEYSIFLTADHGNADYMINPDGSPNTAHTKNPVPLFLISNTNNQEISNGKLADLAPTLLSYLGLEIPKEMTGQILFK